MYLFIQYNNDNNILFYRVFDTQRLTTNIFNLILLNIVTIFYNTITNNKKEYIQNNSTNACIIHSTYI